VAQAVGGNGVASGVSAVDNGDDSNKDELDFTEPSNLLAAKALGALVEMDEERGIGTAVVLNVAGKGVVVGDGGKAAVGVGRPSAVKRSRLSYKQCWAGRVAI
jgi:hypothetical protein